MHVLSGSMTLGLITGNVTFRNFVDRVEVNSGSITENVQKGCGTEDFLMTGGQVQSLSQSDGLNTFIMSGGHISITSKTTT